MTTPAKDIFELFSRALFEGVKPMLIKRDHLVRHPDRCTHNAICIPVCPTGAWLSTPPFKFDSSRCIETCRSQAIYTVFRRGEKILEPTKSEPSKK